MAENEKRVSSCAWFIRVQRIQLGVYLGLQAVFILVVKMLVLSTLPEGWYLLLFPVLYTLMFYRIILPQRMAEFLENAMRVKYPETCSEPDTEKHIHALCIWVIGHGYRFGMIRKRTLAAFMRASLLQTEARYKARWETEPEAADA